MANTESNVDFTPESSNVEFQADSSLGSQDQGSWRPFGGQDFNWNKAAIGVGAAAVVAGAAYAASRYMGRGGGDWTGGASSSSGSEANERSEAFQRETTTA